MVTFAELIRPFGLRDLIEPRATGTNGFQAAHTIGDFGRAV